MSLHVHVLPATYGDCLWIEYGTNNKMHRVLIDGGTGGTKNKITDFIDELPDGHKHFDLMVVTHIDRDHIEGLLKLLEQVKLPFTVDDFWFNGWFHLPGNEDKEPFGAKQGERLTAAILKHGLKWNKHFNKKAVVVADENQLPTIELPGGAVITLLSPYREHLEELKDKWEDELIKEGLVPGYGAAPPEPEPVSDDAEPMGALPNVDKLNDADHSEDTAAANGSSIAFIFEFDGKRILLAGDAYPSTVLRSLDALFDDKAEIDLMKLSHHGSSHNTSPALIEKLSCQNYIISTNGSIYSHPSRETIAWVIKRGGDHPHLLFNYTSDDNKVWKSLVLQNKHDYSVTYPDDEGIVVEV